MPGSTLTSTMRTLGFSRFFRAIYLTQPATSRCASNGPARSSPWSRAGFFHWISRLERRLPPPAPRVMLEGFSWFALLRHSTGPDASLGLGCPGNSQYKANHSSGLSKRIFAPVSICTKRSPCDPHRTEFQPADLAPDNFQSSLRARHDECRGIPLARNGCANRLSGYHTTTVPGTQNSRI
jgi:hypothetical protein